MGGYGCMWVPRLRGLLDAFGLSEFDCKYVNVLELFLLPIHIYPWCEANGSPTSGAQIMNEWISTFLPPSPLPYAFIAWIETPFLGTYDHVLSYPLL
jgi:hypothetical protein